MIKMNWQFPPVSFIICWFIQILVIAVGLNSKEIEEHWNYLETTVLPVLGSFEAEEEARQFVLTRIESLLKIKSDVVEVNNVDVSKDSIVQNFHKQFLLPKEEKLVNCKFLWYIQHIYL